MTVERADEIMRVACEKLCIYGMANKDCRFGNDNRDCPLAAEIIKEVNRTDDEEE